MKIFLSVSFILAMLFVSGQNKPAGKDSIKTCPACHKKDQVIPISYGKPGPETIKKANKGEIKLGGCMISGTSPRFYCKTDKLEF